MSTELIFQGMDRADLYRLQYHETVLHPVRCVSPPADWKVLVAQAKDNELAWRMDMIRDSIGPPSRGSRHDPEGSYGGALGFIGGGR